MDSENVHSKPVWEVFHGNCNAGGNRDVLIIFSDGNSGTQSPDVVPRCEIETTEEDRRKLINQGIPPECSDDLSIIRARIGLDSSLDLVKELRAEPGKELSRSYILEQVEDFLKTCKKPGGEYVLLMCINNLICKWLITGIIYYAGNGKRNTGDWCFGDGVVTFRDITACYSRYFHGRVLTIVSDCSYSGSWVKDCSQYLDEQGVQPCGHSADKNGILLKVYASCKSTEVAATPCFSVRCAVNDKNNGGMAYCLGKELRETQHSYGIDFTRIRCDKKFEEPCALSSNFTWHKKNECSRVFLVRGKDRGRPAWHFVLLVDDEDTIKLFHEKVKTGTVDVADYGEVLKSGWGKDPPNEIKDWFDKNFSSVYD